jgi:Fe-S-cluster containining protein
MPLEFAYPNNLKFECNKCAICCGDTKEKTRHILLLDSETMEIAQKTALPTAEFSFEIADNQPYSREMKKGQDGKCVFLKDNACTIYGFRPLICRFYPFELKFNEDQDRYEFTATLECTGINNGKLVGESDFKKLFKLAQERLEG